MAIATILSRAQYGMEAPEVHVEVDLGAGLPAFAIVGLPETVVRESKDRVRSALINSNFEMPSGRITVNLAPADLPKEGGRFDLPIAIGILVASGQLAAASLEKTELFGELSLTGELRPIAGMLPAALAAGSRGHDLLLPMANALEAAMVKGPAVYAGGHLLDICAHLGGQRRLPAHLPPPVPLARDQSLDLADVRGQAHAKRALEVAAAGEHNLLFIGPPGTGKSMLAQRLSGILPPLSDAEALETAAVRSILGRGVNLQHWRRRPFRNPHHTASAVALVGGGSQPRPGEISLAHNGVLFLDELPEFERRVLEVLREPLETGSVMISRAAHQAEFPARFQLIAAMNPCPCGHRGDSARACRCTAEQVQHYRGRVSGPLLDRLDMHIEVPRVDIASLATPQVQGESSVAVAARVLRARSLQIERQGTSNARLGNAATERHCLPDKSGKSMLERAMRYFALSARAYHRILRVARTIADLREESAVSSTAIGEALMLRQLDRSANV